MGKTDAFKVVVLDLDGAVVRQTNFIKEFEPVVIPLQTKSEALRFWCRLDDLEWLRLLYVSAVGDAKGKVVFYGSGDYHHLAYLGISLMEEPVTVIHFDNHSDFWKTPNRKFIHFGSWVVNCLKLPNIKRFIQLGIDGDFDMNCETPFPMGPVGHVMSLLHSGMIEVYPNTMRRSRLLGPVRGSYPCVDFEPGILTSCASWRNIRDHGGIEATLERVLPTIPTDAVYLTIDKDCLKESDNFAAYPGRQGTLDLKELLTAIDLIGKNKHIVSVDVCGEGSFSGAKRYPLKKIVTWIKDSDIPVEDFYSDEKIRLNERANMKIMDCLLNLYN